uniref:Uncharacterized protein n=1 Tax=Anopheles funestus TaxID=62324 RepID=A0A4Y0BK01_ANOFN
MKELKKKMSTLYKEQPAEEQQQQGSSHWETIYCNIKCVMEQLKIHNLKAQQLQQTEPWSEKDMVNLTKILELAYTCFKDCAYINQHAENVDCNPCNSTTQQPVFGEQMAKLKQQLDLLAFEITKLTTVKEALDNIYSSYNMELAVTSSDQDNEEEDVFD